MIFCLDDKKKCDTWRKFLHQVKEDGTLLHLIKMAKTPSENMLLECKRGNTIQAWNQFEDLKERNPDFVQKYLDINNERVAPEVISSFVRRNYKDQLSNVSYKTENDIIEYLIVKLISMEKQKK